MVLSGLLGQFKTSHERAKGVEGFAFGGVVPEDGAIASARFVADSMNTNAAIGVRQVEVPDIGAIAPVDGAVGCHGRSGDFVQAVDAGLQHGFSDSHGVFSNGAGLHCNAPGQVHHGEISPSEGVDNFSLAEVEDSAIGQHLGGAA
jgi:hypothetical protein